MPQTQSETNEVRRALLALQGSRDNGFGEAPETRNGFGGRDDEQVAVSPYDHGSRLVSDRAAGLGPRPADSR